MKIYKRPKSKLLIRIRITDKNNIERIILCDTTLMAVSYMVERIIKYNEQFTVESNENVLITMRECRGVKHGNSKSLRSNSLNVSNIFVLILNEVTINN